MTTLVDVIIPTRSNREGLATVLGVLSTSPGIGTVFVVGDGEEARYAAGVRHPWVHTLAVHDRSGIHRMWNVALEQTERGRHVLFLNDDVTLDNGTVPSLVAALARFPDLGLVCPNYANEVLQDDYRVVYDTCRGRYHGGGGLAGFCMMLRADLADEWTFDERLTWWYGDDDVLNWVTKTKGLKAAIVRGSFCSNNSSHTINHDPPPDFANIVHRDRLVHESKWGKQ
jgi:hypothetical protein